MSTQNQLLQAALEYATSGFKVFPLAPNSKLPFKGSNGFKDATVDPVTIQKWWTENPDANIGLATGAVSDVFVVDLDTKDGKKVGIESLRRLGVEQFAEDWCVTNTPSGGNHIYFTLPLAGNKSTGAGLMPGVDVRGDGGYIVAPPSKLPEGEYTWVNKPVSERVTPPPAWLHTLLSKRKKQPQEVERTLKVKTKEGTEATLEDLPDGETNIYCPFHNDEKGTGTAHKSTTGRWRLSCSYCRTVGIVRGTGSAGPKWTEEDSRGNPIPCEDNTRALFDHYGITCRYNEMTKQTEVKASSREFINDLIQNATIEYIVESRAKLSQASRAKLSH